MHINSKRPNPNTQVGPKIKHQKVKPSKELGRQSSTLQSTIEKLDNISLNFLSTSDLSRLSICSQTMDVYAKNKAVVQLKEVYDKDVLEGQTAMACLRREECREEFMYQIRVFETSIPEFYSQLIQLFDNEPFFSNFDLTNFDLAEDNEIGVAGAKALAIALQHNTRLKT